MFKFLWLSNFGLATEDVADENSNFRSKKSGIYVPWIGGVIAILASTVVFTNTQSTREINN